MKHMRRGTSVVAEELIDSETTRYIRSLAPRLAAERLLNDPTFRRELAALRAAEQRFRSRATDIRDFIDFEVTHPALQEWQLRSEAVADEMPGRSDLKRLRRRWILRILDGEELGFPLDPPPLTALPPTALWQDGEWRIFRTRDELEYLEMIFVPSKHPAVKMRPFVEVLSHRQARALLDWPSSTLDWWISSAPQLIGGLRKIEITPAARAALNAKAKSQGKILLRPRRTLHRVTFDTQAFCEWLAANQN
ncbi:MAG TPA: hypothetical protein VGJ81_23170 [Thermoanaerobaculia bacterium]|jgi:hypothetical protein